MLTHERFVWILQTCQDPAAFTADMAVLWAKECNIYSARGVDVDRVGLLALMPMAPFTSTRMTPCIPRATCA